MVGGFTEPSGSRAGFGGLLLGYYDGEWLRYAGKVGTGYDQASLHDLRGRLDQLERARCPFVERVGESGRQWFDPELVVQIAFSEWGRDGKLRPRYTGLRTDKPARDVVREGS